MLICIIQIKNYNLSGFQSTNNPKTYHIFKCIQFSLYLYSFLFNTNIFWPLGATVRHWWRGKRSGPPTLCVCYYFKWHLLSFHGFSVFRFFLNPCVMEKQQQVAVECGGARERGLCDREAAKLVAM